MARVLLNTNIIHEMVNTNNLTTNIKFQRGDGKNYFFVPTIGIQLYNAKVSWIDQYKKNISFSFNKYENLSLLNMLKSINESLIGVYNKQSDNPVPVAPFFYEKDELFYIRVYLPNLNKKYHIECSFIDSQNTESSSFSIPRLNCVYDSIIIDIRNIWENDMRSGFNLELKKVESNFNKK